MFKVKYTVRFSVMEKVSKVELCSANLDEAAVRTFNVIEYGNGQHTHRIELSQDMFNALLTNGSVLAVKTDRRLNETGSDLLCLESKALTEGGFELPEEVYAVTPTRGTLEILKAAFLEA